LETRNSEIRPGKASSRSTARQGDIDRRGDEDRGHRQSNDEVALDAADVIDVRGYAEEEKLGTP
jgi:hypothetical protein